MELGQESMSDSGKLRLNIFLNSNILDFKFKETEIFLRKYC